MRTYDVIADYGLKNEEADRITLDAGCVIAVYRYKFPVTFSRSKGESFSQYIGDATELREPLFIVEDINSASVTQSKTSHVGSLSAVLAPGLNYVTEIMPGDYLFCWMVQSQSDVQAIVQKLKNGEPANKFMDGLKFFGKVASCRRRRSIMANGTKVVKFTLQAAGFTEFDGSIYYEPYLAQTSVGLLSDWLQKYGVKLNEIIAKNGNGVAINSIIPTLLEVFFGRGIPTNSGLPNVPRVTEGLDNPFSFVVPKSVASVFGVTAGSKPGNLIAYTDLLEVTHGVQKYDGDQNINSENVSTTVIDFNNGLGASAQGSVFQPRGVNEFDGKVHFTGIDQLGTFVPSLPAIQGQQTAWTLIQQFLNPAVNEIYTTLRTNLQGSVFPTFILRQLPFSSGLASETYVPKPIPTAHKTVDEFENGFGLDLTGPNLDLDEQGFGLDLSNPLNPQAITPAGFGPRTVNQTYFTELPRWRIHPVFMKDFDIGRSDAMRFNFIHVYGEAGQKTGINVTGAFVRDAPVRDDLDIARSGLRPYMRTVPCAPEDIANRGAGAWMALLSDFLMGQHLTLTGTLETDGIQQPIAVGDNLEVDDVILHIESVEHSFASDGQGNRKFNSRFALTHGVNAEQVTGGDESLYTGMKPTQLTRFDPTITVEGRITNVG